MKKTSQLIITAFAVLVSLTAQSAPTNEQIMGMMMDLKQEIAELKKENKKLKGDVEEVVEVTDEAIKSQMKLSNKSTFGGYGELHGNWLEDQKGVSDVDEVDFHRFVLFFNHEYSDKLRFVSEVEIEHSYVGDGTSGYVELEQAYVEYDLTGSTSISAGLFLIPIGLLNQTHEPDTFYGVERNDVEKNIIPTTWWESGAMITAELVQGLSLKVAISTGLKAKDTEVNIRDGRQKSSKAKAESFAYTANLEYTAIPGIRLGGTINYQEDFQNGGTVDAGGAILTEIHADITQGPYILRALYANWDLDGNAPEANGADEQKGWYIEPSYKVNEELGFFVRYATWDNTSGSGSATNTEYQQTNIGLNWWIDPQVVFKVDYQDQDVGAGISNELDGLNLGVWYSF